MGTHKRAHKYVLHLHDPLPDAARGIVDHGLAFLAAEGLPELGEIFLHVVHAVFGERVWIGGDELALNLRTKIAAPGVGVRKEEPLSRSPAVGAFLVD